MHSYKLKFLAIEGDMALEKFESDRKLETGDVIQLEDGNWHYVMDVRSLKTGNQLVLAESAQSAQRAEILGKQLLDG